MFDVSSGTSTITQKICILLYEAENENITYLKQTNEQFDINMA